MKSPGVAISWSRTSHASGTELLRHWRRRDPRAHVDGDASPGTLSLGRRSPKHARLEAALLVAGGAMTASRLAQCAMLADARQTKALIEELNELYDRARTPFRVERAGSGYQLMTRPEYVTWLDKLHQRQTRLRLTPPSMETLAIVAYKQPITRADVEAVRGVQSSEMLKQLMERNLVRIAGEEDTLGRPYLYGTTRLFLELFGLRTLNELPMAERFAPPEPVVDIEETDEDEAACEAPDGTEQWDDDEQAEAA